MGTLNPTPDTYPRPTRHELAAAITRALEEAGVSRLEASERTGIPRETFYRKCRGGSAFDADDLALVAQVLGTTVSELTARAEGRAA